jgi:hypothetical protein
MDFCQDIRDFHHRGSSSRRSFAKHQEKNWLARTRFAALRAARWRAMTGFKVSDGL